MKRLRLAFTVAAFTFAVAVSADEVKLSNVHLCCNACVKGAEKAAAKAAEAAAQVPAKPAKPVAPVFVAPIPPLDAVWHTWRDNQGHTVEAMFCGLSGAFITLQSREGKVYHFNGNILCQEDIDFARQCAAKAKAGTFGQNTVTVAAAEIDRVVAAVLEKNGLKPNPPASDEQFLRRVGRKQTTGAELIEDFRSGADIGRQDGHAVAERVERREALREHKRRAVGEHEDVRQEFHPLGAPPDVGERRDRVDHPHRLPPSSRAVWRVLDDAGPGGRIGRSGEPVKAPGREGP